METIEQLDAEIEELRARVSTLQTHRANLSSILLSQPHLESRLEQRLVSDERRRRTVIKLATQQSKRNQENIYRACAGVTAFKVKDPDPCAVDNGNILGVRVDISVGGRFVETYHVLFNRPSKKHDSVLRIHKHTIPPCIPLQQLVNKWLPATKRSAETAVQQNLVSFGRQLRKELVSWHMRIEAVEKLRLDVGLGRKGTREHEEKEQTTGKVLNAFVSDDDDDSQDEEEPATQLHAPAKIIEIESDVGVREITITWSNEQRGVIRVSKDGQIEQAAVRSRDGVRDMSLSRKALGRIEGLVQRLNA